MTWSAPWMSGSLSLSGAVEWVYHATSERNLPGIRKKGLIPQLNEGLIERDEEAPPMVYFAEREDFAKDFGSVLLRFPLPDDFDDATYKYGTEGLVTYKRVPPEVIQVKSGRQWKPLKGSKR